MTIRSVLIALVGIALGILAPVVVPDTAPAAPASCSSSGPVTVGTLTFDDPCVTVTLVDVR